MIVHYGRKRWHLWTAASWRQGWLVGVNCAGIRSTCRLRGRCRRRRRRRRWRSINQCTAAAAAAEAAAILSMALAANMKYHTAKPFFMNIKFRLTISISCTNVSVTKFALGLGQRAAKQAVIQSARQTVKSRTKSIQLPNYAKQKHGQYFAVPIFVAAIVLHDSFSLDLDCIWIC